MHSDIRKSIVEVAKMMYAKGFVASNDGNISVRLPGYRFLITASGVSKGFMKRSDIILVDENGNRLSGKKKPSSEIKMHLAVYRCRNDVNAVVHAHPQKATAFSVAGLNLDRITLPEMVFGLGNIALTEYGTPSTDEIPEAISKYLQSYDAVLLENHGALTFANSLLSAYHKMESVEFYARLLYQSKMLGGPKELNPEQVKVLYQLRSQFGMTGKHPADKKV